MACKRAFEYDTSPTKSMTNNLVIDIISHGMFCIICDDCHMYYQSIAKCKYQPYS